MSLDAARKSACATMHNGLVPAAGRRQLQTRLFGWWYITLALAFAALAWRSVVFGAPRLGVILRSLVAAGFALLGVITLRSAKTPPAG